MDCRVGWHMGFGEPAASGSQAVMNTRGIDLSHHRARSVNQEIIQSFDLILTMQNGQKESMQFEFSDVSDHIFLLSEMVNEKHDIDDLYGGVYTEYEQAANEIEEYLLNGFETIIQRAQQSQKDG